MSPTREWIGSSTGPEQMFGYARAVRIGDRILVSATAATGPDGIVAKGDARGQAEHILGKIEAAVKRLGGAREDIVLTRVYLRDEKDLMAIAPVHAEYFGETRPANVLVVASFVVEDFLLEIEAEAIVGSGADVSGTVE